MVEAVEGVEGRGVERDGSMKPPSDLITLNESELVTVWVNRREYSLHRVADDRVREPNELIKQIRVVRV